MWDLINDKELPGSAKAKTIFQFDKVFGLKLQEVKRVEIPPDVQKLADERAVARKSKDWKKSDDVRKKIQEAGFEVEDTKDGQKIKIRNK